MATTHIDIAQAEPVAVPASDALEVAKKQERRGRRWLMWSFIFCPCHLPLSMAVLGVIFGGSAFGALISRNTLGVGIVFGVIYGIGLAIGFRHLRRATKGIDCSDGQCDIGRAPA